MIALDAKITTLPVRRDDSLNDLDETNDILHKRSLLYSGLPLVPDRLPELADKAIRLRLNEKAKNRHWRKLVSGNGEVEKHIKTQNRC